MSNAGLIYIEKNFNYLITTKFSNNYFYNKLYYDFNKH